MLFRRFTFAPSRIFLLCLGVLSSGGCQTTPRLSDRTPPIPASTHANYNLGDKERRDGRFVGLAISGGGSRAAVFGGAVLKELDRLGALGEIDVVSAVSGGGLPASILLPWYILGPGHWWPMALQPVYRLMERVPSTKESAERLGLVTIQQMLRALVWAVEHPPDRVRIMEVPDIRRFGMGVS